MGAVTPAAFPTGGTILTAAEYNKLPRGVVYYNLVTANQTGISTVVDITSMTAATWTATSTRTYRTTIYLPQCQQKTSGGIVVARITDASNVDKQQWNGTFATSDYFAVAMEVIETGLSGSITRKGRISTNAGTVDLTQSATAPGFILVEDIGAA
jgi:hypothetical protein